MRYVVDGTKQESYSGVSNFTFDTTGESYAYSVTQGAAPGHAPSGAIVLNGTVIPVKYAISRIDAGPLPEQFAYTLRGDNKLHLIGPFEATMPGGAHNLYWSPDGRHIVDLNRTDVTLDGNRWPLAKAQYIWGLKFVDAKHFTFNAEMAQGSYAVVTAFIEPAKSPTGPAFPTDAP